MWSLNFLTAQCIRNLFEYTFDIMASQEWVSKTKIQVICICDLSAKQKTWKL